MGLWSWFQDMFDDQDSADAFRPDQPLVSFVLFLREPRDLDMAGVAMLASQALDAGITTDDPDAADNYLVGFESSFTLKHGDHFYLVNSFPHPYMEDPDQASETIPELRLRKAVRDHTAWLSVDLVGNVSPGEMDAVYRVLGKLAAALIDGDCLAIYCPATSQINVLETEAAEQLRSDDPLSVFSVSNHPPVVPVCGDDPRLKAAVAKARRRWPDFVTAFEDRAPSQSFCVKARIGDEHASEFMWLSVTGLENGWIYGRLDNDPVEMTTIRCGDRVRVKVSSLNDWLYTKDQRMVGGFTIEVLRRIQEEMRNG